MLKLDFDSLPKYCFCGERQFLKNEKHVTRYSKESVLILMRKGTLRFSEDGKEIELKAGEYYIQRAGLKQVGFKESDLPNYFYVHFNGNFSKIGRLEPRGTFDIEKVDEDIKKLLSFPPEDTGMEPTRIFYNILHELSFNEKPKTLADELRDYIIRNYDGQITLEKLSNKAYISKNQVINIFKKAFKKTPYKYLNDLRLDKSCELILSTDRPINIIAYSVGFSDYSVFYRAFIKKYDISPADYRAVRTLKLELDGKITTD